MIPRAIEAAIKTNKFLSAEALLNIGKLPEFVVPVDATWYLPNVDRSGYEEYKHERIPGAVFFDIDKVKDETSPYAHMVPSKSKFNECMSKLGIRNDDVLLVYDKQGNFSAPRVLWMLKAFNHHNVVLLNSFPVFKSLGADLDTSSVNTPSKRPRSSYVSSGFDASAVMTYEELVSIVSDSTQRQNYLMLDARPYGRFTGEAGEPRPGMASGHVPGSKSLPFGELVQNGQFVSDEKIKSLLQDRGLTSENANEKQLVLMCGSGVTACVIQSAIREIGITAPIKVYDGSWTEWGQRAPKELVVKGES